MPHASLSDFIQHGHLDERDPFPLARSDPPSAEYSSITSDNLHCILVLLGCPGDLAVLIAVRILTQVLVQLPLGFQQVLDRVLQPGYLCRSSA